MHRFCTEQVLETWRARPTGTTQHLLHLAVNIVKYQSFSAVASEAKMSSSSESNYWSVYYSARTPLFLPFHSSISHDPREENISQRKPLPQCLPDLPNDPVSSKMEKKKKNWRERFPWHLETEVEDHKKRNRAAPAIPSKPLLYKQGTAVFYSKEKVLASPVFI